MVNDETFNWLSYWIVIFLDISAVLTEMFESNLQKLRVRVVCCMVRIFHSNLKVNPKDSDIVTS